MNIKNKGFTLIELLVVIAVIGILSLIVLGAIKRVKDKALDVEQLQHGKELQKAIENFINFEGRPPTPGNILLEGAYIAGNCRGGNGINQSSLNSYNSNWNQFVADMGDYMPEKLAGYAPQWPFCVFYFNNYHLCNAESNYDYGLIFTTRDTDFDIIDGYNQITPGGQLNVTRNCLYPL